MNAIETEHLSKSFRRVQTYWDLARYRWQPSTDVAVDDVSLQVRDGELFGLLGENGAGKTTLIRMLTTTLLPTSGTARVGGHDVVREPHAVRRLIGMVGGDERSFYWRLTGRQNLQYFAALYHVPPAAVTRRIDELLGALGVASYADRRFDSYSTGTRQRFAIARGMLTEPRILFLDEPTRALDPLAAEDLRRYILDHIIRERGYTVLMATHTLSEAEEMCDRVAIVRKGRLVEIGTMEELRERTHLSDGLELVVEPYDDRLREAILGVAGVRDLEVVEPGPPTRLLMRIETGDGTMTRLLAAVIAAPARIHSCTMHRPTLDDIYRAAHASG